MTDAELSAHLVLSHGQRSMWATFAHPRSLVLKHDRLHADALDALDALAAKLAEVIHERAATWETQFDSGPGHVASVSDAAHVIARHLLGGSDAT